MRWLPVRAATSFFVYLSIICAACCASPTSQKGNTVPIANIPTKAIPSAIQDMTPTCAGWSVSMVLVVGAVARLVLAALVVGFTAIAVALLLLPGATIVPILPDLVELCLPVGAGVAGMDVGG